MEVLEEVRYLLLNFDHSEEANKQSQSTSGHNPLRDEPSSSKRRKFEEFEDSDDEADESSDELALYMSMPFDKEGE